MCAFKEDYKLTKYKSKRRPPRAHYNYVCKRWWRPEKRSLNNEVVDLREVFIDYIIINMILINEFDNIHYIFMSQVHCGKYHLQIYFVTGGAYCSKTKQKQRPHK